MKRITVTISRFDPVSDQEPRFVEYSFPWKLTSSQSTFPTQVTLSVILLPTVCHLSSEALSGPKHC